MTSAFDQRIVRVGLELDTGTTVFEGLSIYASGTKYGNAIMNQCTCTIFNLTKDQRNYLLTEASPLKQPRTPKLLTLDVGRDSYGAFRLFQGNVISSGATQPPDIGITFRSLTKNFLNGLVVGTNQSSVASLRSICQKIADDMGLTLQFQATDKQIDNYLFDGAITKQIKKLNLMGGIIAFIDNDFLVVLNSTEGRAGEAVLISAETGMIGVPQLTDTGALVRVMISNAIQLFGKVTIQSEINPAANATYVVTKMNFEVANRDQPFWYTLECVSLNYYLGTL